MQKGTLKIVTGDATQPQIENNEVTIIPHVCNNKNCFGAGFVLALDKKWKQPKQVYRELFKDYPDEQSILGTCQLIQVESNIFVLNMIAQDGIGRKGEPERPLRYVSLTKCMVKALYEIQKKIENGQIKQGIKISFSAPMFGSGLAKGNFNYIKELIQEIWIDKGYDVTIYQL